LGPKLLLKGGIKQRKELFEISGVGLWRLQVPQIYLCFKYSVILSFVRAIEFILLSIYFFCNHSDISSIKTLHSKDDKMLKIIDSLFFSLILLND
jgi:hypothetical protein